MGAPHSSGLSIGGLNTKAVFSAILSKELSVSVEYIKLTNHC